MENIDLIEDLLKKYKQNHIIENIKSLDEVYKNRLISQIKRIDFEEMKQLYNETKKQKELCTKQVSPIDYIDKENIDLEIYNNAKKIGETIIKNDQYAVVTMAGGQGTRLGWDGPKGTFKLKNGKYIFQILTENLEKSNKQYGILPYWYIMTSVQNDQQTKDFFEKNNYFGYDKNKIKFFKQGLLPVLTQDGNLVIENGEIKTASNGNGVVYKSLKETNMLTDMENKKIKWIYLCGVDNIMVNPIDPVFIGMTIMKKVEIASKSIIKKYADEKVGVFCKRNGKPDVIEYIELSEEMRNSKNEKGEFIYGDSGFISHLFSIDAVKKAANIDTEYHLAIKNGLYKFEKFYFDVFKYFDDMLVLRVKRENEFAPIKNKEGLDSPDSALEIYENYKKNNDF